MTVLLRQFVHTAIALSLFVGIATAAEPADDAIRGAIAKSIPLLERGAKGSLEQRKQCFNCHNQGLALMALKAARSRGFEIDADHFQQQVDFTAAFLGRNEDRYREGKGQGGQVDTAGYALWALETGAWQSDHITAAVAEYLLQRNHDLDYWKPDAKRPPSEQSLFTSTYVALRGLSTFGTVEQKERIDARIQQVKTWLVNTAAEDTEDQVFRLRSFHLISVEPERVQNAAQELLAGQREDGGWAQTVEMDSDAYATGTALVALIETGAVAADDPRYRKGLGYLISTQRDGGSWHVVSHAIPFQSYFESGYPHGKDQFISMAAAGWATTALALALPEKPTKASASETVEQPNVQIDRDQTSGDRE